ncbi:MAG TPA: hypothetical protein VF581_07015 [Flavobacterium sp.]|jgi:hypothetical protein
MNNYRIFRSAILLLFTLSLLSCATIINGPETIVQIKTTKPTRIVHESDTIATKENSASLIVTRSRKPFVFTAITDSLTKKDITVRSRLSGAFFGNLLGYGVPGMIVDLTNPKRFTYPKLIYLNSADTVNKHYYYDPFGIPSKFTINVSFPEGNTFYVHPEGKRPVSTIGFLGFGLGADYKYRTNKFVNLTAGAAMDFPFPVPLPLIGYSSHRATSLYLHVSDNFRMQKLSIGYGLSYSANSFYTYTEDRPRHDDTDVTRSAENNFGFGFVFPAFYQMGRRFHFGATYRPSFISINKDNPLHYEHVISFELVWKYGL